MNERERWLVIQGYIAGYIDAGGVPLRNELNERISDRAEKWLESEVEPGYGATVEMALEFEADKQSKNGDE